MHLWELKKREAKLENAFERKRSIHTLPNSLVTWLEHGSKFASFGPQNYTLALKNELNASFGGCFGLVVCVSRDGGHQ